MHGQYEKSSFCSLTVELIISDIVFSIVATALFAYCFSDLDPLQAPHWSVRVRMTENPHCLMSELLDYSV